MVPSSLSTVSSSTSTVSPALGGGASAALLLPLVDLDDAFGLVADVDDDVVAADLEHLAGDDLVGLVVLLFALDPGGDFLVEDVVDVLDLVVGDVELAEEVAVDHSVGGEVARTTRVRVGGCNGG